MEQLKPSLVHDVHLLSHDEQLSAINTLTDAISRIKYNLNAHMPVNRLPLELLTLVFEYASFRDPRYALRNAVRTAQGNHTRVSEPAYGKLLPITHVCQMWRNAALAAAYLWARVDDDRIERASIFIHRSQATPLSVMFSRATDTRLEQLIESSGHRLQRLDTIGHYSKLIWQALKAGDSRLECVTIAAKPTRGAEYADRCTAAFEQSTTTLKGLALCVGKGYWVPSTHFSNLTHLLLQGSCIGDTIYSSEPYLEPLMSLLVGTPRLQYLHLARLPVAPFPTTLHPASLPNLKLFLCTSCYPDTSLHLLSLLKLPADVFVTLDSHSDYLDLDDLESAESDLLQRYQLLEGDEWMQSLTRLEVTISKDTRWVVAEGCRSGFWFTSHQGLRIGRLQPMFPLGSIRALDFFAEHDSHFPVWHQEQLQNLLDFMPSLVSLRFPAVSTKSYQYSATAGLSYCTQDGELLLPLMPGDGDSPIRCPLLTTLCIETPGPWGLERLVPHITDVLAARARAGVPLQSLTLRVPQRVYTMQPLLKDLALRCEPVRREVLDAVALHVEELKLEIDGEAPDELASRGTHWDELSEEAEKYWVTPDGMAPQWFRSWRDRADL